MFRSHWTIIREYVVPIPKLPLITYWYVILLILICVEGFKV